MAKVRTSRTDFRASRRKLPPDAFLWSSDKPDPPASDLIDPETWSGLTNLPDDVSLRTSDHYGSLLKKLHSYSVEWLHIVGALQSETGTDSPIASAALDAYDELQASIYNALVGFYRLAFSALRAVLEPMTIGLQLTIAGDAKTRRRWQQGELRFGAAADAVLSREPVHALEQWLLRKSRDSLFRQKRGDPATAGFARRLFNELSHSAHSRPGWTHGDLWSSNGPVFVPEAFEKWASCFVRTYAVGVLLAKLSCPTLAIAADGLRYSAKDLYAAVVESMPDGDDGRVLLQTVCCWNGW